MLLMYKIFYPRDWNLLLLLLFLSSIIGPIVEWKISLLWHFVLMDYLMLGLLLLIQAVLLIIFSSENSMMRGKRDLTSCPEQLSVFWITRCNWFLFNLEKWERGGTDRVMESSHATNTTRQSDSRTDDLNNYQQQIFLQIFVVLPRKHSTFSGIFNLYDLKALTIVAS